MTNPTSNFGWQMPQSTDLVTDLPADFEVFGQAVDTDFVDLLGGTTGQVLSKTSATDLDFTWINNDTGDITGVTAGTGISGGGTSGTVTVTNSMATEITAKGDLIVGTGNATFDNLPVGTNAQILVADSTASTGLKWATPASGSTFAGCSLKKSTSQSVADNTVTAMTWDQEVFDTDGFHSIATNTDRITIPTGKGGYYLVTCVLYFNDTDADTWRDIRIYKNGANTMATRVPGSNQSAKAPVISDIFALSAGDYIQAYAVQDSCASVDVYSAGDQLQTRFAVAYLGAQNDSI